MKLKDTRLSFTEINNIIDELAKKIIENKKKSICIGLIGDLGTGKTAFTKRLLLDLGVLESVKSPTFTYLIEYETDINICHFDVYRINSEDDLYDIGYYDFIDNEGLVIIEWADLIPNSLPDNTIYFEIKHDSMDTRLLSIYTKKGGELSYVDIPNYNFD